MPTNCVCHSKTCTVDKNILTEPREWARAHYEQGSGSMHGMMDFAKRYNLAYNLQRSFEQDRTPKSVVDALTYLLQMENFTEGMR